jgi:hypothetical protein
MLQTSTSMQNKSSDGWVVATTFTAARASGTWEMISCAHPQKYVRWRVVTLPGTSPVATFVVEGMAKKLKRASA